MASADAEQSREPLPEAPDRRLFTEQAIGVGTALGGPLAGTFLIAQNFRALGQLDEAKQALKIGLWVTVAWFALIFAVPQRLVDAIPSAVFTYGVPAAWGAAALYVVLRFQADALKAHFAAGGKKGRAWVIALFAILGIAVTLLIAVPFALTAPPFDGEHVVMEATGCEVYFGEGVTEAQALAAGRALEEAAYFSPGDERAAELVRHGPGYGVTLEIDRAFWEEPALGRQLDALIRALEAELGGPVSVTALHWEFGQPSPEKRLFHKQGD